MSFLKSFDSSHYPEMSWSVTLNEHSYKKENVHKIPYQSITTGKEEFEIVDGVTIVTFETESDLLEYTDFESQYVKTLMKNNKKNKNTESKNKFIRKYDSLNESIVPTKTNDITKIKGWKSKMFSSISDQSLESMNNERSVDCYIEISDDSMEELQYREETNSWSSDFFMDSLDKESVPEEEGVYNFSVIGALKKNDDEIESKKEEIQEVTTEKKAQIYFNTDKVANSNEIENEHSEQNNFHIANTTKQNNDVYSSDSEDTDVMEIDDTNSDRFGSTQSLIDNISSPPMMPVCENDEINILEDSSDSDEGSKSDTEDILNTSLPIPSPEYIYDDLVICEQTSGNLIKCIENLDKPNDLTLKDYSFFKNLEDHKNLNSVLNEVQKELISQDSFLQKYKEYEAAKSNSTEGLLESPLLESYLKKFSKLDLDEELYTETKFTKEEMDTIIKNRAENDSKMTDTNNSSIVSEKSYSKSKKSYPSGFIWVFGKPIMIDNKELIPRRRSKLNPESKIGYVDEKGNSSDSSCVFIDDNVYDSSFERTNSFIRRKITDEKQIRFEFFKKYKTIFPFILLCKSTSEDHAECTSFNNVSLAMVITVGYRRPMAREVSENLQLLKQSDTVIDSRWAHIAASAVVNPNLKLVERRIIVPLVESVENKLINREVWYEDIKEKPFIKSVTLDDVFVWCPYHSCYNCTCSTPTVFLKNNELIWKAPFDAYCLNQNELSNIKINNETYEKLKLYDTERNTARTLGILFNYRIRNKSSIYASKMMSQFSKRKFRKSNSYIKLKVNESEFHSQKQTSRLLPTEIVISDDEEIEDSKKDSDNSPSSQEVDKDIVLTEVPIIQSNTQKDSPEKESNVCIIPANSEKNGFFRTLFSNSNSRSLTGGITLETVTTDLPEYGLLCTSSEFGYLAVKEFSKDNISVQDPLHPKNYINFKNLELANTWLNKCFKENLIFESNTTQLRWIIAKKGLLRVSKPFDNNIFKDGTIMINKERNIVKKPVTASEAIKPITMETVNHLKRNIDGSPSQNIVKKIRISDIVKQIGGNEKSHESHFQKIDKLAKIEPRSLFNGRSLNGTIIKKTNLLKINIPGFKPSTLLDGNRQITVTKPNIIFKNSENLETNLTESKPNISKIIRTKDFHNILTVGSLKPITNQFQGTIMLNKVDVDRLSVLKKSFPIIVPKTQVLLQNKNSDCVLISPANKTLPLNIKSTPAKSILKSNLK